MRTRAEGLAVVVISRRGGDRIRAGHVWVYRSEILDAGRASPGSLVLVHEQRAAGGHQNRPLGTALYSSTSEIALRLLSRGVIDDLNQVLRERIKGAIEYRKRFVQNSNAYRVVFSEGDFLPGLIVDRYNQVLLLQVLTQAMDSEQMRELIISELVNGLTPAAIVERVDARVRKLEQLPEKESGLVWSSAAEEGPRENGASPVAHKARPAPDRPITEFDMNGLKFLYDPLGGQKTGAFLDQRENYVAAAQYARGDALDVFCYQGGFALHLATVCDKVTGVDSSRPALEIADKNAGLNGKEIDWIEANAFDLLRDYSDSGRQYDCIVLDPPAFAKSKRDLTTALRGYKELNLRALKMLRPGGILVTCSCSYHVSAADLLQAVLSAAQDSHRIVRILENRGAAKDHPNVLGIPETAYLKCLIALVS
jgi:23S rRNA (cytosine1962-C5)-methyltransferase